MRGRSKLSDTVTNRKPGNINQMNAVGISKLNPKKSEKQLNFLGEAFENSKTYTAAFIKTLTYPFMFLKKPCPAHETVPLIKVFNARR